jgi:hypothetical protein
MFCPYCGKQTQEGASFCAICGKSLSVLSTPDVPDVAPTIGTQSSASAEPQKKSSFFSWGRARTPILVLIWAFVVATAFEQLYHDWAGSRPPVQHGPAMAFWAGVLTAMYAPKRRFFWLLWFVLGVIVSIALVGFFGGILRAFR